MFVAETESRSDIEPVYEISMHCYMLGLHAMSLGNKATQRFASVFIIRLNNIYYTTQIIFVINVILRDSFEVH